MSTPALLSTVETADRLQVDRSTLSRWVQLGRITPAMKLPGLTGSYLFDPEEIDRVAAERAEVGS
jgi:predicted site-specific integrase-resolvase